MKKMGIKLEMLLVMSVLALSAVGCGALQDKAAEKVSESIVEGVMGGKVDIQKGGSKIVLEDAELETGEDLEWPKEAMGDLPIPKAKISFIMKDDSSNGCTVTLTELALKDAEAYVEELIAMGFSDGMNMQDEDFFMYSGKRADGTEISYIYNKDPKEGVLTYVKTQ